MKLNYELIRQLLLAIEADSNGLQSFSLLHYQTLFTGYNPIIIDYHLKYLIDAHLAEGKVHCYVLDITPKGRDYLNNVRDDSIWHDVKKRIAPLGQISLDVVSDVGRSFILKALGL